MQSTRYYITEIYDEAVPLASGPGNNLFLGTMVVMVVVILALIVIAYLLGCRRYRKRIAELDEWGESRQGWNLWKLRREADELEVKKAELLIKQMRENYENSVKEFHDFRTVLQQ